MAKQQKLTTPGSSNGDPLRLAKVSHLVETLRTDPRKRAQLGQYFTTDRTATFMASLFAVSTDPVRLLDAGAGFGALSAAFVTNACACRLRPSSLHITAIEVDAGLLPFLRNTLDTCAQRCSDAAIAFTYTIVHRDFIDYATEQLAQGRPLIPSQPYNRAILNPPYGKIGSQSAHRQMLRAIGIETSNLYSAFVAIAVELLEGGGELVAITPRSFCNGPYFRPFRQMFLRSMALRHIHIYTSRDAAFRSDSVLQENVIYHAIKGGVRDQVQISASKGDSTIDLSRNDHLTRFDFTSLDHQGSGADSDDRAHPDDTTVRTVAYHQVVDPADPNQFIQIPTSDFDQVVVDRMKLFQYTLDDLGISVSTGRVVDFRAKAYLRDWPGDDTSPLIYPGHLKDTRIRWPQIGGKKPNALVVCAETQNLLLPTGIYVLVKRFTAKEEARRVVAAIYDLGPAQAATVAFENHLNVYHAENAGISSDLAHGLAIYLNSSTVDAYFRILNGHTQVNATDLRILGYPSRAQLEQIGRKVRDLKLTQTEIDRLLYMEFPSIVHIHAVDPFQAQSRVREALAILKDLRLPHSHQNERSALTLLALLDLRPDVPWRKAKRPKMGIAPLMDYMSDFYGKQYAPTTSDAVRRLTIPKFAEAGLVVLNPNNVSRPANSPHTCYQISPKALNLLRTYGTPLWASNLSSFVTGADARKPLQLDGDSHNGERITG